MGRKLFVSLCIGYVLLLHGIVDGAAQAAPQFQGVSAVFSVPDGVAAFDPQAGKLSILSVSAEGLQERASTVIQGNVWQVAATMSEYIVATGIGRSALDAPIRILAFSNDLKRSREVFTVASERAEVPFLKWVNHKGSVSRIWCAFFDSRYTTKIGYFETVDKERWSFKETANVRMGSAVDIFGNIVFVGRPYGDVQGQDGDLLLFQDGARELLPSYRGVRAVRFIGTSDDPVVFIADGWHQNYGQIAQGRVSLLRRDQETGRYALQIIEKDDTQYGFSKFADFTINSKRYIAALGPKQIVIYGPEESWRREVLYSRGEEESLMDMALAKSDGKRAWFIVADKGLRVVSFTTQP
jgi:hypothetical protein